MPDKVKCAGCGYLGVRNADTREIWDAEDLFRQTGDIPVKHGFQRGIYDDHPLCFLRAWDLHKECEDSPKDGERAKRLAVIQFERLCSSFTKWQQGFKPREHQEMDLAERQRQWQHRESEAVRRWQADQSAIAEDRHRESMAIARSGNKGNIWSNVVAGLIGAIATIAAVAFGWWLGKNP